MKSEYLKTLLNLLKKGTINNVGDFEDWWNLSWIDEETWNNLYVKIYDLEDNTTVSSFSVNISQFEEDWKEQCYDELREEYNDFDEFSKDEVNRVFFDNYDETDFIDFIERDSKFFEDDKNHLDIVDNGYLFDSIHDCLKDYKDKYLRLDLDNKTFYIEEKETNEDCISVKEFLEYIKDYD